MRKILCFAVLALMVFGGSAMALTLEEALALYQNDNIAAPYSPEGQAQVEAIIETLVGALGAEDLDETNEDRVMSFAVDMTLKNVVNKLSQAYYTLANVFMSNDENRETYLKGKHWGLKSLRMNPDFDAAEKADGFVAAVAIETDVEALYWATANWLRVSQKNPLQAVFAGVPAKTQAMNERTLELAPNYVAGGSYRSLGAYYSGLPVGQDLEKSLFYLCHVVDEAICSEAGAGEKIAGADAYLENRTFMAEFYYMETGMWEEAAALLQAVLAEPVGDVYPMMNAYALEHAAELLEEVNDHL